MAAIEIRNDEQALALLKTLLDFPEQELPEVKFIDWPRFELHVKGARYHSTITPELMKSFLRFQTNLNKSYALARYADSSSKLKAAELEELKILVEVTEGSSGFVAALEDQVSKIGNALAEGVKDMEPRQILITLLCLGGLVAGTYSVDSYLDYKKEIRLAEIAALENEAEREERIKTLQVMQQVDAQHSSDMRNMFNQVADQLPQLTSIAGHMAASYDDIIASTSDAEGIELQGRYVDGAVVSELSNSPRNRSVEDRISGVYRIQNVDHSSPTDYRFKLYDVTRRQEIVATLPKDGTLITDQILDLLQDAEWGRKVVALHLITKVRSGRVVKAEIEKVARVEDQARYAEQDPAAE